MSEQAPRRRVAMPPPSSPPRVGKIRLGERYDSGRTNKSGESILLQRAIDYFRVDGDDEVTAPESAASFHAVYGDKPRSLRCLLPGHRAEDVWEGAYRLYGARKLKQRCDGAECDVRSATGGWDTEPCRCRARMIDGIPLMDYRDPKTGYPHPDRCKLSWTLNVFLPDVVGVGVWQIQTGSEISVRRVSDWLRTMELLMGDLLLLEFTLNLVPEDVTPDGKTKEVWVLNPVAATVAPAQLLEGGTAAKQIEAGRVAVGQSVMPDADDPAYEGEIVHEGEGGVEPSGSTAAGAPPPAPPPPRSDDPGIAKIDALCEKHGLSMGEFADAADVVGKRLGRELGPAALLELDVYKAIDAECKRKADVKAAMPKGRGRRREPDDPPEQAPKTPPAGQGTLA